MRTQPKIFISIQRDTPDVPHSRHNSNNILKTLNKSQAKHITGLIIEVHISSFRPYTCTPAQLDNWTPTLTPRTSRIHSLCYQYSSLWLHSPAIPGILPTAENRYMNHKDQPLDIEHFSLTTQSHFTSIVTIPSHSTFPCNTHIYK